MSDLSFSNNIETAKNELRFKPNGRIEKVLGKWVKERIEEAKQKLRDSNRSSSQTLEQSIQPLPAEQTDTSYIVKVIAEDYYDYINKGVSGLERSFGSPYSFKNLGVGFKMRKSFEEFIKRRNIRELSWIGKDGDRVNKILTTANDFKSAAYVLARATKKKGIKPNFFMDETFDEESIEDLSKELGMAVTQIFE